MKINNSIHITEEPEEGDTIHLVERIQVKLSAELSKICHLAKDIYNKANYIIRHYFFFVCKSNKQTFEWLDKVRQVVIS